MVTILVAWRAGWRPPRLWVGFAALFGLLALGRFVHVFGVNTQVPGPWVLLRYVPPVGLARMPGRFKVLLLLAVVVLFACALVWLGDRWRSRRRYILAAVGVTLAFELLPAPRPLYSAAVPRIYEPVAEAPADVRVLQLPFGVRDGTSSAGNFTPLWQFFQTRHGKRLLGGQLSRVSRRRVNEMRADTMLGALITLSEGKPIDALWEQRCIEAAPAFVERSNVAFVVVDRARTPALLREFAMRVLRLEYVDEDGVFELYRPRTGVGADAAVPLLLSHSGFEVHSRP
jgi:hypothetical protein